MKKLSYLLSFMLVFALSGDLFSQGMAGGRGMGQKGQMNQGAGMNRAAYLNLTTDQITKINSLRNDFSKETLSLRTGMQSKAMEIRTLMSDPEKNQSKIISLQKEMSSLRQQLQEKSLQFRIKARKVLTPEQIAMLPAGGMRLGFAAGSGRGMGRGMGQGMHQGRGGKGRGMRSGNCMYGY